MQVSAPASEELTAQNAHTAVVANMKNYDK